MKRTKYLVAIVIVLVLLTQPACDKNRVREAAKASDRIAVLVGSMIDMKRELGAAKVITPAEELRLTERLLEVNTRVKQFREFAMKQTEDSEAVRLNLAGLFNQVVTAIGKLSNEAIFPIKDSEDKQKLLAILNSINVSVQVIDLALRG